MLEQNTFHVHLLWLDEVTDWSAALTKTQVNFMQTVRFLKQDVLFQPSMGKMKVTE